MSETKYDDSIFEGWGLDPYEGWFIIRDNKDEDIVLSIDDRSPGWQAVTRLCLAAPRMLAFLETQIQECPMCEGTGKNYIGASVIWSSEGGNSRSYLSNNDPCSSCAAARAIVREIREGKVKEDG